jgi:hypothetical protein
MAWSALGVSILLPFVAFTLTTNFIAYFVIGCIGACYVFSLASLVVKFYFRACTPAKLK